MDTGPGEEGADPGVPAYSTGWVARRFGVAPATLRTWDRRYGVGPTGRTGGGHRRYLPRDLDRLDRMHQLMLTGLLTAEAARVSADVGPGLPAAVDRPGEVRDGVRMQQLADAALALDQPVVEPLLTDALRQRGVVATWSELIVPVLAGLGRRYAQRGNCIAVEHLFTGCVRTALSAITTRPRTWDGDPPVLLACPDREQHSLPLHALAAALAEIGCPSRILGASVPAAALVSAARQVAPRAVFVWAQTPATARPADLDLLPRRRPPTPVVLGGPGWQDQVLPSSVIRVDSLADAVTAVSRAVVVSAS